jgi:dolichol kinase
VTSASLTTAGRLQGVQPWRRLFHAGNSLVVSFLPPVFGLGRWSTVAILTVFLAGLLAFDVVRLRTPRLNALFFTMFPSLASPRERVGIASSTWYLVGVILVYAIFPRAIAVPAILVLGLADPLASTIGRLWGRRRLGKGTVLGSSVFLAVSFAVLTVFVGPAVAAPAALFVTCVEVLPWRLDDNLTVPPAAAVGLWLAIRLIGAA